MSNHSFYPIGSSSIAWQEKEKQQWLVQSIKSRSYLDEVVTALKLLDKQFDIIQYGALSIDPTAYPLYALKSLNWDNKKPTVLITGGVHGYETSGVKGAILFANDHAQQYTSNVNLIILPCISPWGFEHIARWNPNTVDPNRSFYENSPSEEAKLAMQFIGELSSGLNNQPLMHIDLHETTDSDETEFRPALAARDGEEYEPDTIPDGFYLVGNTQHKQTEFQRAIIDSVRQVTHIAPADKDGNIIGSLVEQEGVIYYDVKSLGLCSGMTNAPYTTVTEVYPDSEKANAEDCNNAQVAAINGAIDFVLKEH